MNNLTRQSFLGRSAVIGTWDLQIPTTNIFCPVGCLKSQPKDIDPEQDLHWPFPLCNSSVRHGCIIYWAKGRLGSGFGLFFYSEQWSCSTRGTIFTTKMHDRPGKFRRSDHCTRSMFAKEGTWWQHSYLDVRHPGQGYCITPPLSHKFLRIQREYSSNNSQHSPLMQKSSTTLQDRDKWLESAEGALIAYSPPARRRVKGRQLTRQ